MSASSEITERGLFHRLLDRVGHEGAMDDRESWADAIEGAIRDAAVRAPAAQPRGAARRRPLRRLGALGRRRRAARRGRRRRTGRLDAVRAFMTDGAGSPLYGRDPLAARGPPRRCAAGSPRARAHGARSRPP